SVGRARRRDRVPDLRGREQHQRRDTAGRQRLVSSLTTGSTMWAKMAASIRWSKRGSRPPEPPSPTPGITPGSGFCGAPPRRWWAVQLIVGRLKNPTERAEQPFHGREGCAHLSWTDR